jgi:hypothetical protein
MLVFDLPRLMNPAGILSLDGNADADADADADVNGNVLPEFLVRLEEAAVLGRNE